MLLTSSLAVRLSSKPGLLEATVKSPVSLTYDLVIVGGGIVGLTLACALKNSGIRMAVVEATTASWAASKGQAYALTLLSSKIFQGLGLWDRLQPQVTAFQHIRLSDTCSSQVVEFCPKDLMRKDALGYVVEHRTLLEVLHEELQDCPTLDWFCPAKVWRMETRSNETGIWVQMDEESKELQATLVVAADGARSPLRQQAGIKTVGWKYWQSCIVATVKPEHSHQNIAYERFFPSGPFAILPLPRNRCRIVWTAPHAEAQALCALDDESFLQELKRRYGNSMGNLALEGDRHVFPVQLMQSKRYVHPRLALVGDAAHCCHPVGGQGLNLGIRDAATLAQVIRQAYIQGQDIGSLRVLKSYERWRQIENWIILGMTDLLNRVFSNQYWPLVQIRRVGLWLLRSEQGFRLLALRLMTGLSGHIPSLALGGSNHGVSQKSGEAESL